MNIYVGNLDFKVKENELSQIFEEYGAVSSSKIITDKFSGRSRGFGFVTMENAVEANRAITALNGAKRDDRDLIVNEALPKKQF
jgi:RNA recognition motif-containing protein